MQRQILVTSDKIQPPISATISLESLATCPEQLVEIKGNNIHLKDYNYLSECKCYRFYDRTDTKHDQLSKGAVNIPYGFNTPLNFFESVIAEYLANQFYSFPEIHLVSFGSGYLLRELIIIAKLIKNIEKENSNIKVPPIYLHAVDRIYKQTKHLTSSEWLKSPSYLCQKQFKNIIQRLDINVTLLTYSSIGKYNQKINNVNPAIIFSIDAGLRYDSDFPMPDPNNYSSTDKQYTQEGILTNTKQLVKNGSLSITLTHIETNKGMFIVLEKKENDQWRKEWIYTIVGTKKLDIAPPIEIKTILAEREKQFFLSDAGRREIEHQKRFEKALLSLAVKEYDDATINTLLNLKDPTVINAQSTDGFTALHWAAMRRYSNLIKQLIAAGADPTIKNMHNRTPLDYYKHQVSPEDFKDYIDSNFYQTLCYKYPIINVNIMPEFYELYHYEDDIEFAFKLRNDFKLNTAIFYPTVTNKDESKIQQQDMIQAIKNEDLNQKNDVLHNQYPANNKTGKRVKQYENFRMFEHHQPAGIQTCYIQTDLIDNFDIESRFFNSQK